MDNFVCFLMGVVVGLILFMTIILGKNEPCAMDVYQGKTTLKYTVINGIKMDSTVIWTKD